MKTWLIIFAVAILAFIFSPETAKQGMAWGVIATFCLLVREVFLWIHKDVPEKKETEDQSSP